MAADRPTIAFAETQAWERAFMERRAGDAGWDCRFFEEAAEELRSEEQREAEVLSCFIRSKVTEGLLDECPQLRLVATRSAGFDHVDLAACRDRGVTVCNVPQYGENTVAEHTFGLILNLSRHICAASGRVRSGDLSIEGLLGFDLYGKTLGVIGAGRIGLHVIRIGRAMNMRVLAYEVQPYPLLAEVLGFEYADLDRVLRESDVVSVHVPLLASTRHLLNAERLALMKPTAILINTSRGAVVDSKALLVALSERRLAGAALDVVEGEEVITEDKVLLHEESVSVETLRLAVEAYQLIHHPRIIVTPHIGFYSEEALHRILQTTADNIAAFLSGTPQNVVPGERPGSVVTGRS